MGLWQVMKCNLSRWFRKKSVILSIVLLPIAILLVSTLRLDHTSQQLMIGISENISVNELKDELNAENMDGITLVKYHPDTVHTDLLTRQYDIYLETNEFEEVVKQMKIILQNVKKPIENRDRTENSNYQIAMIMMVEMMAASILAVQLIKDRNAGMISRCKSCGVAKMKYIGGVAAAVGFMIALQTLITIGFFQFADARFLVSIEKMLIFVCYITIVSVVFGMILAFICKKEMNANLLASGFVIVFSLLGGGIVSVDSMPVILQKISWFNPIRILTLI